MSAEFHALLPIRAVQPDALGVWQTQADPTLSAAGAPSAEAVMLWRVMLPADPLTASARLARTERLLSVCNAALPDAGHRLREFVAGWPAIGQSFAVEPFSMRQPERELALLLTEAQAPVSFGGDGGRFSEVRKLAAEARGFVAQVWEILRYYAEVETVQDGVLVARTSIGWLGDARALGQRPLRDDQVELHRRALALALQSRIGWIRLATQMTLSILLLGAGLATANPILVASGAWKFIKDVLGEWRRLSV